MKVAQSATQYSMFQADASGDLTVTLTGDELIIGDENLEVCAGGACPAFTLSGTGNLVVEGDLFVGGDTSNYIQFSDTAITYAGTAKPKRSIILTAPGAVTPATNGAAQAKTNGTNHSYYTLGFDSATEESAYWQWVMPDSYDGGTVDVTIFWYA